MAGLCEDTTPPLLSISGSPKEPYGWPMRRYPSPCFFLYREALKILLAGICKDTHPPLLSISESPKEPCGWPMRRYPSPASLYIGMPEKSLWLAYAMIPIPCFSLYREAQKILVAGLCEDTHSMHLSISGSLKDPCGWPMRRYPSPVSLYIGKP